MKKSFAVFQVKMEGDPELKTAFQSRFSDTTDTTGTTGTTGELETYIPSESTEDTMLTKMDPYFKKVVDAIVALREGGGSPLIDDFLTDYSENLSFYRWLDAGIRIIADYGYQIQAMASEDTYLPDTLDILRSVNPHTSEFNMIVPLLLSPLNRKDIYYGGFSDIRFMKQLLEAIAQVLFRGGKGYENPGNTELFATYLQEIGCPPPCLREIDPEIRKLLTTHSETTPELSELHTRLTEDPSRSDDTESDEHDIPEKDVSCESSLQGLQTQFSHNEPVIIDRELLAYLTMCEKNKAKG